MNEENPEVDDVEVGDGSVEPGRKAPGPAEKRMKKREGKKGEGQRWFRFDSRRERKEKTERDSRHEPITKVVGMTRSSPPSRGQELGSSFSLHRGEVCSKTRRKETRQIELD